MKQYIDKAKVVAEIEKIYNEDYKFLPSDLVEGVQDFKDDLLMKLETLKTKEVDLEKETTHYLLYEHRSPLNEIMHKVDIKAEMQYHKDIENAFKAGFELGLKAKDVNEIIKTAEDYAYFAGSENTREKLIDKACKWWEEELSYPSMTPEEIKWYKSKVNKFRKTMEE